MVKTESAVSGHGETKPLSAASGQGGHAVSLSPEPEPSYSYSYETESESGEPGPASTVKPAAVPCFDSEASGSVCRNASNLFVKYDYRRAALADMTEEVDDGVIRAIVPKLLALPPGVNVHHGPVTRRLKEEFNKDWPATLVLPQPQFWVGNVKAAEKPHMHRDIGYRALVQVAVCLSSFAKEAAPVPTRSCV